MKRLFSVIILLISVITTPSQENQWDKYVPEKQRTGLLKKAVKVTGLGAAMTGQDAWAFWITDSVARVLVSRTIDKERLTIEEAEERYKALRPKSSFLILLNIRRMRVVRGTTATSIGEPLAEREIFLQRAADTKQFSKGAILEHNFDINLAGILGGAEFTSTYYLMFPEITRDGETLIKSLDEKIEFQFVMSGKKVVLEYKIKDLAAKLEDL